MYERNHGRGKTDKEYSIRLSLSEGAHSSNVLDSALDARHSLNVQPRRSIRNLKSDDAETNSGYRKLTQHLPYSDVIAKLSKHFHRLDPVRMNNSFTLHRAKESFKEEEPVSETIDTVIATPITTSSENE